VSKSDFNQRVQAVQASRDKWIDLVESRLRDLTGLRLSKEKDYKYPCDRNDDETPIKRSGKASIVIFPTNLIERDLGTDDQDEVWSFILGRIDTHHVFKVPYVSENRKLDEDAKNQLESIRKEILLYDDCDFGTCDVLGVFAYRKHVIKLYAQIIAWHSINDGIDTEDLAFVVLAHELAHAYTMAGYDIDGYRGKLLNPPCGWNKYIIEGLAQYYTEAICCQLKKAPQFKAAFDALLAGQTEPYTWHRHWFNGYQAHEIVRPLLLDYRDNVNSEYIKRNLGLSDTMMNSIP
jgi:hypothetical protein